MAPVTFNEIEVDRCPQCGGLFFDATELVRLLSQRGSPIIDQGSRSAGRELDKIPHIHCPRCLDRGINVRMITMVDADQPHIRLERCPACGGTYLDAGEFTDLKHHTMADLVRDLRSGMQHRHGRHPFGHPLRN